jgi:hypothetical protein
MNPQSPFVGILLLPSLFESPPFESSLNDVKYILSLEDPSAISLPLTVILILTAYPQQAS